MDPSLVQQLSDGGVDPRVTRLTVLKLRQKLLVLLPGDGQADGVAFDAVVVRVTDRHGVEILAPKQLTQHVVALRVLDVACLRVGVTETPVEAADGQTAEAEMGAEGVGRSHQVGPDVVRHYEAFLRRRRQRTMMQLLP